MNDDCERMVNSIRDPQNTHSSEYLRLSNFNDDLVYRTFTTLIL